METSFKRLSRWQAVAVLALLAVSVAICVGVSLSPMAQFQADGKGADVKLFKAVADRIRGGESYYAVMREELTQRGYPTHSIFNYRTPLTMWLIGQLAEPRFAKLLLCLLAAGVIVTALVWTMREGGRLQALCTCILLVGGLLPCLLGVLYVMPVLWAGTLIALSICALGIGWQKLGVGAGVAAVFFRELAGPYCVLGLAAATYRREWREVALWLAGLAAYGVYFLWHCSQILPGGAGASASDWLQFGGAAFLIATTQMNGYLLMLPQWAAAVYLPVALLGFASWQGPSGRFAGLTALGYVALFTFIGQEINQYWGALTAPLLCLGAGRAPLAVRDLLLAICWPAEGATAAAPGPANVP